MYGNNQGRTRVNKAVEGKKYKNNHKKNHKNKKDHKTTHFKRLYNLQNHVKYRNRQPILHYQQNLSYFRFVLEIYSL